MSDPHPARDRAVRTFQWAMAVGAVFFIGGIVTWIGHLIRTAWRLQDTPSASIGISLVAIPVFLTLLGVVLYVFVGLLGDRGSPPPPPPEPPTRWGG
ncbi:MAG: hypothetical protein ACE5JN_11625 [Candidatus Methylomirabilia bacterium]